MTAEEKTALAKALDLADDYLRDGYACDRGEYAFTEDPPQNSVTGAVFSAASLINASPSRRGPADSLEALKADICGCTACPLHKTREKVVIGDGPGGPLVLILGDAPGREDEEAGKPFAGPAGELLDRMLGAIALSRGTNCYLTHLIKCRPPEDGNPSAFQTAAACAPFLKRELALLKPLVILGFERATGAGIPEAFNFLKTAGIPFFSTHHPALIRSDEGLKRPAWEKLKTLSSTLTGLDRDYAGALRTAGRT
ncbi:MAG: uracil-DNA glycosylase [Treponema sp.]|jgi:DNA polymerase|nr:uracil-DNA glycosylase [Treponema sp.]